ncbi:MAG TPA: LLM class flavin-dependent oxidoreductase [Acidimicrobiales bacterium]|nr:LLM class flavin-dependent oxidoreductase [Acidimicrobiales bacterium]
MKVRIGVGMAGSVARGTKGTPPPGLGDQVDAIADLRFDSLWLPEVLTAAAPDPLVTLAWVAGRTPKLKVGTTCLLPGRNVLRLAKQLATLDVVSGGRLLLCLVPGLTHEPERSAIGVPTAGRGAAIDTALPLLRRLWSGAEVTAELPGATLQAVTLDPLPVQQPLEPWLGGNGPAALERCGRLSDGWLPALTTPEEAAAGRQVIEAAAAAAGRSIDPEHFGVSIGWSETPISDRARASVAARSRGGDPDVLVPVGLDALRSVLEGFIAVGFSKFVVRPISPPPPDRALAALEDLAAAVLDLQT